MEENRNNYSSYESGNQYYQTPVQQYQTPSQQSQTSNPQGKPPKKKKDHKFLKLVAAALVFGLVAGTTFQGVNYAAGKLFPKEQPKVEAQTPMVNSVSESEAGSGSTTVTVAQTDVAAVAKSCMPSIVAITNMGVAEIQNWFGVESREVKSAGSGIIVGENETELLIATNNHVVQGANTLTVTFVDAANIEAHLKGTDSDNDVAVIAVKLEDIESSTRDAIKIATLGDSDTLTVGEPAIAIGNALGYGQSVTAGIVSATNRSFSDRSLTGTYIQTDAAINPGNSGGALLNAIGEVIGINVAKEISSEVDSMGYAIPISVAKPILDDLMNRETRDLVPEEERGALGIYGADVDSATAAKYNMPTGVYISDLVEGGAAEKSGLQKGDIITKIDGSSVSSMTTLKHALQYYRAGESVNVTVSRSGASDYEILEIPVLLQQAASLEEENNEQESTVPDAQEPEQTPESPYENNGGWDPFGDGEFNLYDFFNLFR